ncbi:tetratricopeptide repeat protein [Lutibacter citreus]|uniref:tetratricopeptide repeat protein n=1 Tax=Lutibacter citreus TaxID=2138210 RepID=UPI000DBE74EA|nr:tetratricopeptide repeat protein [Lutibacter citreus]
MVFHTAFILLTFLYQFGSNFTETGFESFEVNQSHFNQEILGSDSMSSNRQSQIEYFAKIDTLHAIDSIIKGANTNASIGNYSKSYDGYWEALIYSSEISDSTSIGEIYTGLGVLYSMFGRSVDAEKYFNLSLSLQKKDTIESDRKYGLLSNTYYMLSCHNRENNNYGIAQSYLDSCWVLIRQNPLKIETYFLEAEQGYLFFYKGEIDKGLDLLLKTENEFISKNPSYLVILYYFLGNMYFEKRDYKNSEKYYIKSLEFAEKYNSHQNYVPRTYQKLANLYVQINRVDLAFKIYSYQKI